LLRLAGEDTSPVPRPHRVFPPDSVLHVINRGNDRRRLFTGDADYRAFRHLMRYTQREVPLRLLAYVLMPNHWHLVVWPHAAEELWRFLQRLTGTHASRLRRQLGTVGEGHIYQGRYKSVIIETQQQFVNVMRYVEANPMRSGLVTRAEDWRWSSLPERMREARAMSRGPLELPPIEDWVRIVNAGYVGGNTS
jgi:putative transposase